MSDRALKSTINRTQELIGLWAQFRELYEKAVQGSAIAPEEEKQFLHLKSQIARRYQALVDLADSQELPEARSVEILSSITSLAKISSLSVLEREKIDTDWHTCYIAFNRFLGGLEAIRDRSQDTSAKMQRVRKILFSPWLTMVYLIVLIVLVYMVWFEWLALEGV